MRRLPRAPVLLILLLSAGCGGGGGSSSNPAAPWSQFGGDAQHMAQAPAASQPLSRIHWSAPVDLAPQYSGDSQDLLIHYGSPLIAARGTVVLPVKTGPAGGFRLEGRHSTDGSVLWTQPTDYQLPPHGWVPSFGAALDPSNRLVLPGAGGTVLYRSDADAAAPPTGTMVFYGAANFSAAPDAYRATVFINTPITSDRAGDLFFGFLVTGANPLGLRSGIARLSRAGAGTYVAAPDAAGDAAIDHVVYNAAPALSGDGRTLYVPVRGGGKDAAGYLLALDSRTLATVGRVRLKDARSAGADAILSDDGTASPTVGPDGDVYYGVIENPAPSNHLRGWLLHFSADLAQTRIPGSFGWDDTASVVPASAVPSYRGASSYLLMTKYNDYADSGGSGINRIAVLDPNDTETDPIGGAPTRVMREVLTVTAPTSDPQFAADHPGAVKEWCINSAAVDPATHSILVNNEDGILYRWDLITNTLTQPVTLTAGVGEAYTPTVVGPDGTVYAINNATLFAVGQ